MVKILIFIQMNLKLPSALFVNIEVLDITPFYWTLMFNFIIIGVIAFLTLKYLCPNWKLGLNKKELKKGLKKIGIVGIVVGVISEVRIWTTNTLKEYIKRGFVLNDESLKNGPKFGKDYFKELLEKNSFN